MPSPYIHRRRQPGTSTRGARPRASDALGTSHPYPTQHHALHPLHPVTSFITGDFANMHTLDLIRNRRRSPRRSAPPSALGLAHSDHV